MYFISQKGTTRMRKVILGVTSVVIAITMAMTNAGMSATQVYAADAAPAAEWHRNHKYFGS